MKNKIDSYAEKQMALCSRNDSIAPRLFEEYGVYRGLRDEKGNGVLTGLTGISDIVSSRIVDGRKVPCDGELWYRGYEIKSLISGLGSDEFGLRKSLISFSSVSFRMRKNWRNSKKLSERAVFSRLTLPEMSL